MKKHGWPLLFVAPFIVAYGLFNMLPLLFGFYISLTEWNGFGDMKYIGLQNYSRLLSQDISFFKSVWNSFVIMFEAMIPIQVVGLFLALLLNYGVLAFGRRFFRNAIFLPYLTTPVAIGLIFASIFDTSSGVANYVLMKLGILSDNVDWLHTVWLAKPIVAFVMFWKYIGYVTLIYLAGLQGIPKDIFEAAQVDGASTRVALYKIVVPMLRPIIKFQVTLGIIGTLRTFDEPIMLFGDLNGGMEKAAQTMNVKFIQTVFQLGQYGYGSALGYAIFVIILIVSLIYFFTFSDSNTRAAR
jgi:cellobiose transport system permease protein